MKTGKPAREDTVQFLTLCAFLTLCRLGHTAFNNLIDI